MTFKEYVIKVRDILKNGFCQGYQAVDVYGYLVFEDSDEAVCWCISGASNKIHFKYLLHNYAVDYWGELNTAFFELVGYGCVYYNDRHTKEEILGILDDIILSEENLRTGEEVNA